MPAVETGDSVAFTALAVALLAARYWNAQEMGQHSEQEGFSTDGFYGGSVNLKELGAAVKKL